MLNAWRDLWVLTKACRGVTILLLIWAIVGQVLRLAEPIVFGRMIDILSVNDIAGMINQKDRLILAYAILTSILFALQLLSRKGVVHMIHRVRGSIVCDAFDHMLSLPVGFHEKTKTGSKTEVIQNGAEKTGSLAESWAVEGLPNVFSYILSACVLLYLWPLAGVAIGIFVPIAVACSVLFYRLGRQYREQRHDYREASDSLLVESIQNVATIQSFRVEKKHSKQLRDIHESIYGTSFKEMRFADIGYIIRNTIILCSTTSIMYFGFDLVVRGAMTSGVFIMALILTMRMTSSLWQFGQIIDETMYHAPALRRIRELFATESEVQESPIALQLHECEGSLTFKNVTFRYPGTDEDALHEFSLDIYPNSTVALVGPSGAGKSTVFKMIRRFADPCSGSIAIDGHDLRDLKFSFRQHVAIVSQEIDIFSGTIADNIAFGRTDMSRDEVERYARMAHVDEFVSKFREGYDTVLGERGVRLSGGQRQRVAIARALAADCRIILFDEPTSNLDPESEALIRQAMSNLIGLRTIIIIAHRISTIRHADEIVVMQRGRVVEKGTHETLRQINDGVYQRFLQINAS